MRHFQQQQQQQQSAFLLCLQEILCGWITTEEIFFRYFRLFKQYSLQTSFLFGSPWIYVLGAN